jgi:uncharacterized protein (UPF0210 family)
MIAAVNCGALSIDKLEAMTSVCSVGLDMIAVPGDTPSSTDQRGYLPTKRQFGVINNRRPPLDHSGVR